MLPDLVEIDGRLPVHVEYLVTGPDVRCRVAVTIHTPTHLQAGRLNRYGHLIDLPMTGGASHAFVDMRAVIEISEIGQWEYVIPDQRLAVRNAVAHRGQFGAVRQDFQLTVHADFG